MFAAEIRWLASGPMLKMKGTLDRDWAAQARSLVTKGVIPAGLIVDLTEVSYIDTAGEDLLRWSASMGAEFAADISTPSRLWTAAFAASGEHTAGQAAAAKVRVRRPHERLRSTIRSRLTRLNVFGDRGVLLRKDLCKALTIVLNSRCCSSSARDAYCA
jgi:hypothetical protein